MGATMLLPSSFSADWCITADFFLPLWLGLIFSCPLSAALKVAVEKNYSCGCGGQLVASVSLFQLDLTFCASAKSDICVLLQSAFWLSLIVSSAFWLSLIVSSAFWLSLIVSSAFWLSLIVICRQGAVMKAVLK
jgi:hypothetical protein